MANVATGFLSEMMLKTRVLADYNQQGNKEYDVDGKCQLKQRSSVSVQSFHVANIDSQLKVEPRNEDSD